MQDSVSETASIRCFVLKRNFISERTLQGIFCIGHIYFTSVFGSANTGSDKTELMGGWNWETELFDKRSIIFSHNRPIHIGRRGGRGAAWLRLIINKFWEGRGGVHLGGNRVRSLRNKWNVENTMKMMWNVKNTMKII